MASPTATTPRAWSARTLPAPAAGALLLVTGLALAWAVTWLTADAFMERAMMLAGGMAVAGTSVYLALAGAMMVAMMLPAAVPGARYYAASQAQLAPFQVSLRTGLFGAGYFVVWTAFAAVLLVAVVAAGLLAPMGPGPGTGMPGLSAAGGGVLVAAGAYQLLPVKRVCLGRCSTLRFPSDAGRLGAVAAFGGGIRYAGYCLATCWLLMLALFASAAMGLAWMAGLSMFIAAERLAPVAWRLREGAGVALVAAGGLSLALGAGM